MKKLKTSRLERNNGLLDEGDAGVVCTSLREGAPTLSIVDDDGMRWVLPWVQLLHATFVVEGDSERVKLVFQSHEAFLEGVRLSRLVEGIAKFGVEWVRGYDKRYAQLCPKEMPFVERIIVIERGEPEV